MQLALVLTLLGAPPSVDTELATAAAWLEGQVAAGHITGNDARYYKFFTTYAVPQTPLDLGGLGIQGVPVPQTLRQAAPYVLSFALNSLAAFDADGKSVPPTVVGPTLYVIDIRNYGWDLERWEAAVASDPYVVEPLVDPGAYHRLYQLSGNALVRADWFVVHAMDARRQLDRGLKQDDVIYYILIYGKGRRPKTLDEFRTFWGADVGLAEKKKADSGAVIDKGKSGVSRGSRRLISVRTVLGEYWETRDAVNEDFVEQILSDNFEAGEAITNNARGLQVYTLFGGQKQLVDDGDIKLVVDSTDQHDPRVRTATSCVVCHPLGINEASSEVVSLLKGGVRLESYDYKEVLQKIERFYLAGKFDTAAVQANARYASAVAATNGLLPTQNALAYKTLVDWYAYAELDMNQCAAEAGLPADLFKSSIIATTTARLSGLYRLNKPVPRQYWEASVVGGKLIGGAYAESILHIKGRTAEEARNPIALVPVQVVTTVVPAQIKVGRAVLAELPANTTVEYLGIRGDWIAVRHNGIVGHIHRSQCRVASRR